MEESKAKRDEENRQFFLSLVTKPVGATRWKAIKTIMEKHNMSFEEAQKYQASKITGIDLSTFKGQSNSSLGTPA